MEADTFLLKGLLLGLAIAVPVGPIGVLCIRRSLTHGFAAGLAGGLGTALADALYAALAAFGFAVLLADWIEANTWVRQFGAMMLLYLAWQAWNTPADVEAAQVDTRTLAATFAATFLLTMTNPMTIVTFLTIFTGFGIERAGESEIVALVLGVFLGSLGWWIILAGAVSRLRARIDADATRLINRGAAALLAIFAFLIAGQFI
jgi:putative LysE/RhtB family amino acid efflux pump